jgi:F-type H+-transporting ATPase subunit b
MNSARQFVPVWTRATRRRLVSRWTAVLAAHLLITCVLALTVLFSASSHALAQEASAPASSSTERASEARQQESPGDQLAEQSREAAGEGKGENDELKKSPAVSFVAKLTGMSLEHAYWLCMGLNFAVIAGVIVWISRTKLPGVFRNRSHSIQKAMQDAAKASDEANRRLSEIESRLARLDTEIGTMRAAAEQEAAAEEGRIKAAAEEDTRKIVQSAEQEVAAAAKLVRRELRAFAADLSVELAQRMIRVDPATDQALVRNFSDQLGDQSNGSGSGKDGH